LNVEIYDLNNENVDLISAVLGINDENLKMIGDFYNAKVTFENGIISVDSQEVAQPIKAVFDKLIDIYRENGQIESQDLITVLHNSYYKQFIVSGIGSRKYYLRTTGQKRLYDSFEKNVITFAIGPAGTGKTFLAVCYAYSLLKQNVVRRIIITRPVVETGESLGFQGVDLREKVDPYLRPIYDSFEMLIGQENLQKMIEKNIIEIAPLAYMRGRTLNEACVILDEAQNTTPMQIKMFMTRLGFNSKMIITGDITQIDLPAFKQSGLIQAMRIVDGIDGVSIIHMHNYDVVRHPIVSKIIDAYEENLK